MELQLIHTKEYLLLINKNAKIADRGYCVSYHKETEQPLLEIFYEEDLKHYKFKPHKVVGYFPLSNTAINLGIFLLPDPCIKTPIEKVYVLMADGDGTMISRDIPFGIAVKTKEEAEEYLKNGNVGYTDSYEELMIFNSAAEGIAWKYNKLPKEFIPKTTIIGECDCPCHTQEGIMHFMACCHPEEIFNVIDNGNDTFEIIGTYKY